MVILDLASYKFHVGLIVGILGWRDRFVWLRTTGSVAAKLGFVVLRIDKRFHDEGK
jgi:hypothetical protein